ncbi:sodium-dependent transporter [Candidatus Margulisiibacteriota bacterium]
MTGNKRVGWKTKLGIILAVTGSAVGIGNFLRFPVQAASNGGGAFMIPYFVSFLLLGIPLMWIEWAVGRFGGFFGHGTAPGIFNKLSKNRIMKYFGIIGIVGPLIIFVYYTYIESWLLAYAFFALTGKLAQISGAADMAAFLQGYQGLVSNKYFTGIGVSYLFFLITFTLNIWIIKKGIAGGIEKLCKFAMPLLFVAAIMIAVRVFTLGAPNPAEPDWNIWNGLGFLWNPNLQVLTDAKVWLAAAGQVFFTLSVGIGVIMTYASYLKRNDDIVLSGLSAASANEFAEIVLGGSIVIPLAFAFYGPEKIVSIAQGGAFNLGFITMPLIFGQINFGMFFAFLWFFLLFLAGLTSSVSLATPAVAFMEDEFGINKKKAVTIFAIVAFLLCQPSIFFLGHGVVSELDFWGGTFCLVLFATIETVLFSWVYGIDKAWKEIHHGSNMDIPIIYKFIIKYITPLFLFLILGFWLYQDGLSTILMRGVDPSNMPYILGARIMLIALVILFVVSVKIAWKKRHIKL